MAIAPMRFQVVTSIIYGVDVDYYLSMSGPQTNWELHRRSPRSALTLLTSL